MLHPRQNYALGQPARPTEPIEQSLEKVFGPIRRVSTALVLITGAIVGYALWKGKQAEAVRSFKEKS